jgi:hypothetical protein
MRIEVHVEPLNIEVNALGLAQALASAMPGFYARQMLRGRKPDGGAMPTNKRGEPLGLGNGTIATNWWASAPSGSASSAEFSTGPYQEGGYFYPVRALVERGSSPVGAEGQAGALIDQIVAEAADRAIGL